MGNMHLRVYLVLVTYMASHKLATYSSDIHSLEISSDSQEMDINETVELEKYNG